MEEETKKALEEFKSSYYAEITHRQYELILDYITNLQEELEDLREDNYAYHQLIRMENKREYRSKFLKEFQQEYNTNTFPDYDEIYKRYDKLKEENERLKEEHKNCTRKHWQQKCAEHYANEMIYKSRNEKANTLLDELLERAYIDGEYIMYDYSTSELLEVKQALQGEDKE